MNSGETKADRTRAFIVERASDLFNKKGYAGTTLSDLMAVTGLSKGGIYGNFENKEEVALAVFEYNCHQVKQIFDKEVSNASTYHERLMAYAKMYGISTGVLEQGGCPILNTAVEADDTNPSLKKKAAVAIQQWRERLEMLIQKGILAGEFKNDAPVKQTALSIISIVEGGLMIRRATDDHFSVGFILDSVEQIINRIKV
ncbi:MAG TPA: TetR/AcrR family transcriptional regulator [Mucilaginibacter sp.]|jgi:TetR/AcrR family transcriptional repressor of nem operon|nr:TetR/AcrR family transcriptional regulator [Mucilaginibacter sp.]